jgi:FdhE protein
MSATIRILPAEEIAALAGGSTPYIIWPQAAPVFAERELRLRQVAAGHTMVDFLRFVADLVSAQRESLRLLVGVVPVPDDTALTYAVEQGYPPLLPSVWPLQGHWRQCLSAILTRLQPKASAATLGVIAQLAAMSADELDALAERVLRTRVTSEDMAAAPLVASALQAYWTVAAEALAQRLATLERPIAKGEDPGSCPCCGSLPTASIIRASGGHNGQRYLHCSLCNTQWHRQRIECTHCGATENVHYHGLTAEGVGANDSVAARAGRNAVQAETCDDCQHYLKVMYSERDPMVDAVADDLATLTLDVLVGDAGWNKHGVNMMLWMVPADDDPPPGSA